MLSSNVSDVSNVVNTINKKRVSERGNSEIKTI